MHASLCRADGTSGGFGDLLVTHVLGITQRDRFALSPGSVATNAQTLRATVVRQSQLVGHRTRSIGGFDGHS